MTTIGLDFGTTNTILSFYDCTTKTIETYKMGGADGENYIPSFLTIDDDEILLGKTAKDYLFDCDECESYSKFKMLLSENDKNKLNENGFKNKSPKEISKLYLTKLLDKYKSEQNIKIIDKMVVSIPEIWLNDNKEARVELESIIKSLDVKEFSLKSEPVSAGAYFLYKYKEKNNTNFNGHFLIFDYGGGTLDITLLESNNDKLKVLERTGKGTDTNFAGKAGVAYDQFVIQKALKSQYNEVLNKDEKIFQYLCMEFERKKISLKDKLDRSIEKYRKTKLDKSIFKIEKGKYELSITPSLLIESFDELLKNDIVTSLDSIKQHFEHYKIDENNDKKFKIVLVGGFSSFSLSQATVMEYFGNVTKSDKRFEQDFTKEDLSLAISKGVALLANEIIEEKQVYPHSIGIVLHQLNEKSELKELEVEAFRRGDLVNSDKNFYSSHKVNTPGIPIIFFDDGLNKIRFKLKGDVSKFFANHEKSNNHWYVGFSVDINNFYYFLTKDSSGEEFKIEFTHLLNDFKDSIIIENNNIQSKDILEGQLDKLKSKSKDIKEKSNFEDSVNTFSNSLEPTIGEIIKRLTKRYEIKQDYQATLTSKINSLKSKLSKQQIDYLYEARNFRNDFSHQKHDQFENMDQHDEDLIVVRVQKIVLSLEKIKKEYNL